MSGKPWPYLNLSHVFLRACHLRSTALAIMISRTVRVILLMMEKISACQLGIQLQGIPRGKKVQFTPIPN